MDPHQGLATNSIQHLNVASSVPLFSSPLALSAVRNVLDVLPGCLDGCYLDNSTQPTASHFNEQA